jgi:hypothetical protein
MVGMIPTTPPPETIPDDPAADPIAVLHSLTSEQIVARLDELEEEARGLRVLLRSIKARERAAARRAITPAGPEGARDE